MLTYLIKSILCAGVLYGYYLLALRNQSYHRWNRVYLLSAVISSLLLPLLHFSFNSLPGHAAYTSQLFTLQEMIIHSQPAPQSFNSSYLVTSLYLLVSGVLLCRLLLNYRQLYLLRRNSQLIYYNDYMLSAHADVTTPFSFFNTIFWGGDIRPGSREGLQILKHEQAHVKGLHSADKLFLELIHAACWINPFFYFIKKEIGMVHEFIADKAASTQTTPADYARTLLQMTLESKLLAIPQHFAQPPVKRRINLLFSQPKNYAFMKKLLIFPIAALLVILISWRQNDLQPMVHSVLSPDTTPPTKIFTVVDKPPAFPGGEASLARFLSHNIHYPAEARKDSVQGLIRIQFVVNQDGSISEVKTVGPVLGKGLEEEGIKVVKQMPNWIPGSQNGELVRVVFNLPIKFTLGK